MRAEMKFWCPTVCRLPARFAQRLPEQMLVEIDSYQFHVPGLRLAQQITGPAHVEIATKHWHACDLDTHTLTQCSQLARRDDAHDWGGETLAMAAIFGLTYVLLLPLTRALRALRVRSEPAR